MTEQERAFVGFNLAIRALREWRAKEDVYMSLGVKTPREVEVRIQSCLVDARAARAECERAGVSPTLISVVCVPL
jgi:hypothetical protein